MRTVFHEQLDSLSEMLSNMCGLAGLAMDRATQALLHADLVMAEQVFTDHDQLAHMQTRAEEAAFALLALQAPVAGDLRLVFGSFQNAADAERMGALALHVAKIARRRHPNHVLPDEVEGYFGEMGRIAVELGNSAKEVVLSRDPKQAAQISRKDDAMDQLHKELFSVLMDKEWKHGVEAAVDVTLLGLEISAHPCIEGTHRFAFSQHLKGDALDRGDAAKAFDPFQLVGRRDVDRAVGYLDVHLGLAHDREQLLELLHVDDTQPAAEPGAKDEAVVHAFGELMRAEAAAGRAGVG